MQAWLAPSSTLSAYFPTSCACMWGSIFRTNRLQIRNPCSNFPFLMTFTADSRYKHWKMILVDWYRTRLHCLTTPTLCVHCIRIVEFKAVYIGLLYARVSRCSLRHVSDLCWFLFHVWLSWLVYNFVDPFCICFMRLSDCDNLYDLTLTWLFSVHRYFFV